METLTKPMIQIAGVKNQFEADLIMSEGVKYIGFPLRLDYHEPDLSEDEAATIIHSFPADVNAVLITYENNLCEIIKIVEKLSVPIVQFHGDVAEKTLTILRRFKEKIVIIKSLIVEEDNLLELKQMIDKFQPYVDAFITDTFDPETGASGATGKTHNWNIARQLVIYADKPVILAGGLDQTNVTTAIREVRPYGVDVHTGVEDENGDKDRLKLRMFVQRAKQTYGIGD
jgi:phosphoribosylanthranilate isomerase